MSFWSRKPRAGLMAEYRTPALTLLFVTSASGSAAAAQYYFEPQFEVSTEVDTNRDLVTSGPTVTAEGYAVSAGAKMGIATPTSDTTLLPRFGYIDYPKLSEHSAEELMDFSSAWRSQRSQFYTWGEIQHQDLYGSELASAAFNPLIPNLPTTPETGRISSTGTRTLLTLDPKYVFDLTQRWNVGASGVFQSVEYGGAGNAPYVSFRYYLGTLSTGWSLSPRSDVTLGIDASRETATNQYAVTDGRGATLAYGYRWSQVFTGSLQLVFEHDTIYGGTPADPALRLPGLTTNGVGASYATTWKGEISQLQLTVGRTFTPSGAGGTYRSDQFQAEYKRNLTPRLAFDGAARYIKNVAVANQFESGNYNYVTATADLSWFVTRTWYVGGGLQYLQIRSPVQGTSAHNSMAHISFGYRGLPRQQ
jgi:hypothetical protein